MTRSSLSWGLKSHVQIAAGIQPRYKLVSSRMSDMLWLIQIKRRVDHVTMLRLLLLLLSLLLVFFLVLSVLFFIFYWKHCNFSRKRCVLHATNSSHTHTHTHKHTRTPIPTHPHPHPPTPTHTRKHTPVRLGSSSLAADVALPG